MPIEQFTKSETKIPPSAEICALFGQELIRGSAELSARGREILRGPVGISHDPKILEIPGIGVHPITAAHIELAEGQVDCIIKTHGYSNIGGDEPRIPRAYKEFGNHSIVAARGIRTVVPLAAAKIESGESLIVTEFDPRLQSATTDKIRACKKSIIQKLDDNALAFFQLSPL